MEIYLWMHTHRWEYFLHHYPRKLTKWNKIMHAFTKKSEIKMVNWLTDWLIDWLINWLIDWLLDWLLDWLVFRCGRSAWPKFFIYPLSNDTPGQTWRARRTELSLWYVVFVLSFLLLAFHLFSGKRTFLDFQFCHWNGGLI